MKHSPHPAYYRRATVLARQARYKRWYAAIEICKEYIRKEIGDPEKMAQWRKTARYNPRLSLFISELEEQAMEQTHIRAAEERARRREAELVIEPEGDRAAQVKKPWWRQFWSWVTWGLYE